MTEAEVRAELTSRLVTRIGDRAIFACDAASKPDVAYYIRMATGRPEKERPLP